MTKTDLVSSLLNEGFTKISVVHHIGKPPKGCTKEVAANYTTIDKVRIAQQDGLLTFDGVSRTVWDNRFLFDGSPFLMFIMGAYVGGTNEVVDSDHPREDYCSWDELMELSEMYGGIMAWHGRTHMDMTRMNDKEVLAELEHPDCIEPFLSWPYGKANNRLKELAEDSRFRFAFGAGHRGDGTPFWLNREYVK